MATATDMEMSKRKKPGCLRSKKYLVFLQLERHLNSYFKIKKFTHFAFLIEYAGSAVA
jgi:hypothetical protein